MAQAPLKICPGCRKKFTREARCPECAAVPRSREKRVDDFYVSAPWRRLRALHLQANPLCDECERHGLTEPAYVVDHIVERSDDPSRELDPDNLRSLCASCHNRKTANERVRRRRGQ